jgi:glutathione S-transferase
MPHRPLLVIGNKRYSSWSLRPWLFLRHSGIDFDERVLALDTAAYASDIGALSPTRRVPVLHDGELVVWDSLAICEYANERWLGGRGWPADIAERAIARAACAEMHSGFAALRNECPMNVCRQLERPLALSSAAQADVARVRALWRELRTRHGAGGDFLFGAPGLVDAYYAPVVMRFWTYRLEADAVERAYVDAVRGLPAMREWIAAATAEREILAKYEAIGVA